MTTSSFLSAMPLQWRAACTCKPTEDTAMTFDHFDAEVQGDELAGLYEERCQCGGAQLYSEMCLACQEEICRQEEEKEAYDSFLSRDEWEAEILDSMYPDMDWGDEF